MEIDDDIEESAETLIKRWRKIAPKVNKNIDNLILKLDVSDGKVLDTPRNLEIISSIYNSVDQIAGQNGWDNAVQNYVNDFKDIDIYIAGAISEVADKSILNVIATKRGRTISTIVDKLVGNGMSLQLKEPLKNLLSSAVIGNSTLSDLREGIRSVILGSNGELSQYERYVTQISRDSMYQYIGLTNKIIGNEFELKNFRYTGPIIPTSRWQCRRWHAMGILNESELEEEIKLAFEYGKGMIEDTTASTWEEDRGGYNCNHITTPTSEEREIPYEEIGLDFGQE